MQELSNAYEVLSNEQRRAVYDRLGEPPREVFDLGRGRVVEMHVTLEEAYSGSLRRIEVKRSFQALGLENGDGG